MLRRKSFLLVLTVCLLATLLTACGGAPSVGVQEDVCVGMTQEELIAVNGDPDVTIPEDETLTILCYDAIELYDLTFRADYSFNDTGLIEAVYITDYVEADVARTVYDAAYADVVEAMSSLDNYYDDGVQGVFGVDERVSSYVSAANYSVTVSYEYGMVAFTVLPTETAE